MKILEIDQPSKIALCKLEENREINIKWKNNFEYFRMSYIFDGKFHNNFLSRPL